MKRPRSPLALLTAIFAGWVNRHQRGVIDYLLEENRILRAKLGRSRLLFTEPERHRRTSWKRFLKAHAASIVATDFFTTEVWTARGLITHYAPVANEWATNTERTGPAKDMSSHMHMAGARLVGPKRTCRAGSCRKPGCCRRPPRCGLKPKTPPCTSKENITAIASEGRRHGRCFDLGLAVEGGGDWAPLPPRARMPRADRSWPSCGSTPSPRPTSSRLFPRRAWPAGARFIATQSKVVLAFFVVIKSHLMRGHDHDHVRTPLPSLRG